MPRFAILWHEAGPRLARSSHFDLLFEDGSDARAWFVDQVIAPNREISAAELPRHRLFYLDYEGPVSGDRGSVTRWDFGEYVMLHTASDHFEAQLQGQRLQGFLRLNRAAAGAWRLRFEVDG
jgi:hypothetical protein